MTRIDSLCRVVTVRRRVGRFALALLVGVILTPGSVAAQENSGAGGFSAGVDFTTDYYFRGIIQETEGFIAQPFLDASLTLMDTDDASVSITAGTWSSLHSAPESGDPEMWYETDFYASLGLGFAEAWSADVTYTAYMSPNQSFGTVKELSFGVGYDDGMFGPYATFAFELDGQADGGANEGVYLELGVEPAIPLGDDSPVGLSVPVTFGLSLSDYYEPVVLTPLMSSESDTFGFFSIGLIASMPLPIPVAYGSWDVSGGVNFLAFGDALESINGDSTRTIGIIGVSVGY